MIRSLQYCCLLLLILVPSIASAAERTTFDHLVASAKAEALSDTLRARATAAQALERAKQLPDVHERRVGIATALWLQAEMDSRLGSIPRAVKEIAAAQSVVQDEKGAVSIRGSILATQGVLDQQAGDVTKALAHLQAAYRLFAKANNQRDSARTLMSLGALYAEGGDFLTALKYLDQAIELYHGDPQINFSIYNNRASLLQELGRYLDAENNYRQALNIAYDMKSDLLRVRVATNMARVELKAGELATAQAHIAEATALSSGGEAAAWRPEVLVVAAQTALAAHNLKRAKMLIDQRFSNVDPDTTTQAFREAHQTAYDTDRALGENGEALVHLAALKRLDDQATKVATQASAALATAQFDFTNQKLRITGLERDQAKRNAAFERARAATQRQIFIGSSIGLSILIGVLVFALVTSRRARRQVEAANDDLAVTNTALGKALAAKTEFLAVTSHEIRTPLNGILGMTQVMLADRTLPPDTRDRLGIVHGAGVTMRALVDDILDVAKMETGKLTIEHVAFDLCEVLRDATRMWDEQARAKGLAFTVTLEACPSRVVGDSARLRQIVFNLLSNAIKFTSEGAIAVRIAHDGARARIAVSDSGIGIDPAQRDAIFESFRQADAGTTRQFGGTGLGLTICRNLARAMGGDVSVESEPGQGATFILELPLAPAPDSASVETAADAATKPVVIVDRNPISRAMFRTLLQPQADDIRAFATLDELASLSPALIVADESAVRGTEGAIDLLRHAAEKAPVALLWAGEAPRDLAVIPGVSLIAKPIVGTALQVRLRSMLETPALVREAA